MFATLSLYMLLICALVGLHKYCFLYQKKFSSRQLVLRGCILTYSQHHGQELDHAERAAVDQFKTRVEHNEIVRPFLFALRPHALGVLRIISSITEYFPLLHDAGSVYMAGYFMAAVTNASATDVAWRGAGSHASQSLIDSVRPFFAIVSRADEPTDDHDAAPDDASTANVQRLIIIRRIAQLAAQDSLSNSKRGAAHQVGDDCVQRVFTSLMPLAVVFPNDGQRQLCGAGPAMWSQFVRWFGEPTRPLTSPGSARDVFGQPFQDFMTKPGEWEAHNTTAITPPACITSPALCVFLSAAANTLKDDASSGQYGPRLMMLLRVLAVVRVFSL